MLNRNCKLSTAWFAAIVAAAVCSASGYGQVLPADQTDLRRQGFGDTDFRSYEVTRVAPNYQPYREWQDCLRSVATASLGSGKSAIQTESISFGICTDQERAAYAIIARSVGAAKADRVMKLGRAIQSRWVKNEYDKRNPPLEAGMSKVAGWTLVQRPDGICRASRESTAGDLVGLVILEFRRGEPRPSLALTLPIRSISAALSEQPRNIPFTMLMWAGMQPRRTGPIVFEARRAGELAVVIAHPTEAQITTLSGANQMQLEAGSQTLDTFFNVNGLDEAWPAVQRCLAAG